MEMAMATSRRSTCHRLKVGCILLDARGQVLSTGYNGRASGLPNCDQEVVRVSDGMRLRSQPYLCPDSDAPSGQPNGCESIHAEQNALLQCEDVWSVATCHVTHSPCVVCVKLLLNTSCRTIFYAEEYPHPASKLLWTSAGRGWEQCSSF